MTTSPPPQQMAPGNLPGAPLFELVDAAAAYRDQTVLSGIDLSIARGERVAIMGRSGAGKSTLLSLLHAQRPDEVALVPQAAALVKPLSVFHNVYMGRLDRQSTAHNLRTLVWPRKAEVEEVRALLETVGLADKLFVATGELSGGQQQRTSVARALYNGRPVLLGDEPVSALDRTQGEQVLRLLLTHFETLVLVLHDIQLALSLMERVVVLEQGRKVLDARTSGLAAAELIRAFGGVS